jgi:thiol-disulfide isomerase/thioredoxin
MSRSPLLLSVALAVNVGCFGTIPEDPIDTDSPSDAGTALPVDARTIVPGEPDAAAPPPEPPDAAPLPAAYPAGPYGTRSGEVMENLSWMGYVDDDGDGSSSDDTARSFAMEELFAGNDPGARIIMINSSAGWCGACQDEASHLAELHAEYHARGARIVTTLFETTSGAPATLEFARDWSESFGLPVPTVADPTDRMGAYYESSIVPMNMFVDPSTMQIVDVDHGFSTSYTRSVFDAYVD